jgi:hypothetical protein
MLTVRFTYGHLKLADKASQGTEWYRDLQPQSAWTTEFVVCSYFWGALCPKFYSYTRTRRGESSRWAVIERYNAESQIGGYLSSYVATSPVRTPLIHIPAFYSDSSD